MTRVVLKAPLNSNQPSNLPDLSTPSRLDPFRFQAGDISRRPNLALGFLVLVLCCSILLLQMHFLC